MDPGFSKGGWGGGGAGGASFLGGSEGMLPQKLLKV